MNLRSRLGYLGAVVGLGAALVACYRIRPPGPKDDPVFMALQAEEKALAQFDRRALENLRRERDLLARRVTAPPVDELKHALGERWSWTAEGEGRFAITCRGEKANDWPALLAGLVALEQQPGVYLESARLAGDGRRLVQAKLAVRVRAAAHTKEPGENRT